MQHGLDYNARGRLNRSLLHAAARYGSDDMVHYLLSLELDLNCRDKDNETPVHYALKHNRLSLTHILEKKGADIKATNFKGQNALHLYAKQTSKPSNLTSSSEETAKFLISKGFSVNGCDNDGNTRLHLCKEKNIKQYLVNMGANINAKNKLSKVPSQTTPSCLWE